MCLVDHGRSKSGPTVAQKWRVARQTPNRNTPFTESAGLERCALRYVERYATTRGKLASYLRRKIRERGWEGEGDVPIDALVDRFAALGYVDDQAFAEMRTVSMTRRGYGKRRIDAALQAAGIAREDLAQPDEEAASQQAIAAALNFAKRRRIGPFGPETNDPVAARRAFAAMVRAGHTIDMIRKILDPGNATDFMNFPDSI